MFFFFIFEISHKQLIFLLSDSIKKLLLTLPLEIYRHHQFEHIYHENLKMNLLCGLVDVQIETMYPPIAGEMYNLVMLKQENKNNMMRIVTRIFLPFFIFSHVVVFIDFFAGGWYEVLTKMKIKELEKEHKKEVIDCGLWD